MQKKIELIALTGGRETLEREALEAMFTRPDAFPALLNRMRATANSDLQVVIDNTSRPSRPK